ncbi:hypothetical protein BOX15_Mlig006692g1 [Macrostomum lignano]|uniref:Uncharacterized protein n=1 Tax=Macrostomum lignano TaxID=282301 RepID=A0A267FGA0_9PLAT|nr:hypothetical protein BOX15_Mlig006692g1 [Macrostomum lignano]
MAGTGAPTKEYVDKTIPEQDKLHSSKQRDNAEAIAATLSACASSEKHEKTTKLALTQAATILANVEEYRDSHVRNLEDHVLYELARFGNQHRGSQTDLRKSFGQSQRSRTRKAASAGSEGQRQQFSRQLLEFETRRVTGLRSVLVNYVFSELAWHLKAAELYSNAFKALQTIDETGDVEEFRRSLQLPRDGAGAEKLDKHRQHSSTLS